MRSLLQTEAVERAALITVTRMHVELWLAGPDGLATPGFRSAATIYFDCAQAGDSFVDFKGETLHRVDLNGSDLDTAEWRDGRIPLTGLRKGENRLHVSGDMAYSSDGEGLHRHVDPADGWTYLYAMSFLDAAPRWFACFDQPDMKAPYDFLVHTPADWQVWGNGPCREADPEGWAGKAWAMEQPCPLATYFVTLVAGPWASVTAEGPRSHRDEASSSFAVELSSFSDGQSDANSTMNVGTIPLTLLARQSLAKELERESDDIIEVTRKCFDAYHGLFGVAYPFGSYVQAFVPDFNAGAMENPGCVTFRDQYLLRGRPTQAERAKRAATIAHEMAHQWFGDLVTMRWWDDLWLNESFAEYMGTRIVADHTQYDSWTPFGITRQDWGSVADQGPNTHPVAVNGAADAKGALANFDGISYAKGASLLRQLATGIGDETFFAGLRGYFAAHRFKNATLDDLLAAWSSAGAANLGAFADEWLRTSGMDMVTVADGFLTLTPGRAGLPDRPASGVTIDVAVLNAGKEVGRATMRDLLPGRHLLPESLPWTDHGHAPGPMVMPDAGGSAWLRRRPSSWSDWPSVDSVADPATRVVLFNTIRDAVRSGDLPVDGALMLLQDGLRDEASDDIMAAMLGFGIDLAGLWSPWAQRNERLARWASIIAGWAKRAEPGSDRQMLLARQFVRCAGRPVKNFGCDTQALARLLGEASFTEPWCGLEPDPGLRWAAVTRLVALGEDEAIVDQELARDPAGVDQAAGARSAAPTALAKQAALGALLEPSDARAYELYEIAENIWQIGQEELCEPFVRQWFLRIGATAQFRDGWALARVAWLSFPVAMVSPAVLEMARSTLAATKDDRLRRELADGLDLMTRVLRAQSVPKGTVPNGTS